MATGRLSQIGVENIKWWDGKERTYSVRNYLGGIDILNAIGYMVDVFVSFGSKDVTGISTALGKIGSADTCLLLSYGEWSITSDLTIPSNVWIYLPPGSNFNVSAGITLTLPSPSNIIAAPNQQIFSGAGIVSFNKTGVVYPQWWGAKADGINDDTVSIKASISCLNAIGSVSGSYTIYSNPELHFPNGVYVISAVLTADTANIVTVKTFSGDDAILKLSAGITCFGGVSIGSKFKGLQFQGGACAISIKTNNTDTTTIDMDNCTFHDQTGNAIQTDTSSGSTVLTVKKSKYLNYTGGDARFFYGPCTANAIFEDCWVVSQNATNAAFYCSGRLIFRNMFGVPYGGAGGLIAWVDNYGDFFCYDSRFGGEDGGSTYIVRNYAIADITGDINSKTISITNSYCYTASAPVYFYAIPNVFIMKDNIGFIDLNPFIVDSTVVAGDLNNIGSYKSIFVVENNSLQVPKYIDPTVAGVSAKALQGLPFISQDNRQIYSLPPAAASITINTQGRTGAYGISVSGDATPSSTTTDGLLSYTITATAGNQYYSINYATMLNGVAAGLYTLAVAIDVTSDHAIKIYLGASNSTNNQWVLGKGRHIINMPFYHDGSTESVNVSSYNMPDTAVWVLTRIAVYAGKHTITSKHIIMEDTAAPGAGTWYIGDYVINSVYVVGAAKGWMYTSLGAWTADANW